MSDWRTFWNGEHAIYVNAVHKDVHYRAIADGILDHLARSGADPEPVVLDYACGEALEAGRVAAACRRLVLCDGAPSVVAKLKARLAGDPKIACVLPEDLDAALADGEADLIVVVSLIQYLSRAELEALLRRLRAKLKPAGRLVLADVVPADAGMAADVASLLANGWRHGFLSAALVGLAATALSPYAKLRSKLGLATYAQEEMLALLSAAGFAAERFVPNLGLTPHRLTFVARPA